MAAAGARARRNRMWTSGEPSGEGEGYERKKIKTRREGEKQGHMKEMGGKREREREIYPGRQYPNAKH